MDEKYSRALGTLYGVAIGDAFGMPVEMWSRDKIKERFGKIDCFLPGQDDNEISHGFREYDTTDDTIVTFLVAETLIESTDKPDPISLVNKIEKWALENSKSKTVIGPSTKKAFDLIKSGTSVEEAGRFGTTNGASMRISPAGIAVDVKNIDDLVNTVRMICMPTHNTDIAISAASAIAAAISEGINGSCSKDDMIKATILASERGKQFGYKVCSPDIGSKIRHLIMLSDNECDDAKFLDDLYNIYGTGLPIYETVPAAIAICYRANFNIMKSAFLSANAGGDTDTMGAMACAISGAYSGVSSINDNDTTDNIRKVNDFDFEGVAQKLLNKRNVQN